MQPRDLRVSDAEREHVGRLLERAAGQGMLSLGEFSERMDTAFAAKTRGELNVVLTDLPGIRLVGDRFPAEGAPARGAAPRGHGDGVIRARLSGVQRRGRWQVPETLRVDSRMAGVTLDFTEAIVQTQTVAIEIDSVCSSTELIVPTEATVDLNGVDLVGGSTTSRVASGPPGARLHLVVRGRVRFGSVTAKHPFGTSWRRLLLGPRV